MDVSKQNGCKQTKPHLQEPSGLIFQIYKEREREREREREKERKKKRTSNGFYYYYSY